MHTKKFLATTLLTSSLVLGLSTGTSHAQEKALQPQSSWALTKVDRAQQGGNSYCTLSRKYDDNVVLSLARNQTEEYSLAIDFQKPVFENGKSVKVNLQPGPGQIRAYDLMPTSDKAIVIRLGWDTGFFDTLNQSQNLKATVGGQDYSFGLSEIAKGQTDLQDCMNSIIASAKGTTPATPATDVLNAEATAGSAQFAAQKGGDTAVKTAAMPSPALPPIGVEKEVPQADIAAAKTASAAPSSAPIQTNFNKSKLKSDAADTAPEPAAKLAAVTPAAEAQAPAPVIVSAPEAPKPTVAAEDKAAKEKAAALEKEVAAANAQKKALQDRLEAQQKAAAQLAADKAKAEQAGQQAEANATKLKQLENQIAQLTTQNAQLQQTSASVATMKQQNETLQAQIRSLQEEAAGNSKLTPIYETSAEKSEAERLKQEIAALKAQNSSLQSQIAAQPKTAAAPAADSLAKEVESLKAQNKALQDQLAAKAATPTGEAVAASPLPAADAKALADAQAKIKELEIKNAQLNETLRQSQTRIAETAINTEGAALRKIADLETKLDAAKADNATLAQQLDSVRLQQEDKRLNVVAGDWDLEKATKRFNEAEREIRRLGLKLEQERSSCNREKAQIENMLFDPAVTDEKQREKLVQLETQLREAQDKLAGRISETSMSGEPTVSSSQDNEMIARLQQENQSLRMQITDLQSNAPARADRVASAQLDMQDMKRQMALKDSQNEALQNSVNYLQKENKQIKARTAAAPVPRAPSTAAAERNSDRITSNISHQRERLARSGDPAAAQLASMDPAAGGSVYDMAAAKQPQPQQPAAKPAVASNGYDTGSIQSLLQKSGLSTDGVKKAAVGMEGADNFSWTDSANGNVRGLASVKVMASPSEFEGTVNEYIANQKAMCPGDFASIPADNFDSAAKKMALYEIACVSGSTSSSASVVFFEDQGRFIAVANQTNAKDMDVAMDSRDRVANFVRGL